MKITLFIFAIVSAISAAYAQYAPIHEQMVIRYNPYNNRGYQVPNQANNFGGRILKDTEEPYKQLPPSPNDGYNCNNEQIDLNMQPSQKRLLGSQFLGGVFGTSGLPQRNINSPTVVDYEAELNNGQLLEERFEVNDRPIKNLYNNLIPHMPSLNVNWDSSRPNQGSQTKVKSNNGKVLEERFEADDLINPIRDPYNNIVPSFNANWDNSRSTNCRCEKEPTNELESRGRIYEG